MKKLLTAVVALMLVAAFALSALAVTMYVDTDPGKVYKKKSKSSDVISRLPYGGKVDVFETSGKWSHISYINKKGQQRTGWMLTKHLSSTAPCKHKWSEWKIVKKATCSKEGEKSHYCTKCGITKTEKIKKTAHKWGKWTVLKKATCKTAGEKQRKCKVCGTKEKKKIAKAAHTFGEPTIEKEPTCSAKGVQVRECTECGYKSVEDIDPLPHSFGEWTIIKAPTRDADGERTRACEECGFEERETVSAQPAFARSDRSDDVRTVQEMLNDLGYNAGGTDGIYGPKLDKAFDAFARDNGVAFDAGRVIPSEIDALMSAWISAVPADKWKGEGGADEAVDLTLEISLDEVSDEVRSYKWSLTNDGTAPCTLKAVLMGGEANHDFRNGGYVVVMDAEKLKAKGGNTVEGTFNVPAELLDGEEAITFCALAEADKNGEKWLSNAITFSLVG